MIEATIRLFPNVSTIEAHGVAVSFGGLQDGLPRQIPAHQGGRNSFRTVDKPRRIARDRPYWSDIPRRIGHLFSNLTSFRDLDESAVQICDPERW